ncbi:methyl-accepting chemotaxis protein [Desulfuromonas sp. AOP6]|uniref:methyl-accepting chemotaxis protein n=1 Tax=Desulfuromonas sp. AOP6 TaxID=1566351 RepID=UPI0012815BDD|nr:methyl-accepting chemotaxis protein [Desulfuromonas sp. AOP6]BCA79457.1 chemotaxis protein [Desulfuromonas sp. AOP6]
MATTAVPAEKELNRSRVYATGGFALGILAPLGWILLRLILFWNPEQTLWQQIVGPFLGSEEGRLLYAYMGLGTALVLGVFGFYLGKTSQRIHERALHLDELNTVIARQKAEFERKFRELDNSIKNFHSISNHIQKSLDVREVLKLAADGLHDILGYDRVNILMVNRDRQVLEFIASRGCGGDDVSGITLPLDVRAGALYKVVSENRLFLIDDITRLGADYHLQSPYDKIAQLRSRRFILCPIVVRDQVVGLFGVDNKINRKHIDDTDVDTVKLFADQVASTITKIDLLEAVDTLTGELETTFQELLKYRQEYGRLDFALRRAAESNAEATVEISHGADVVQGAVTTTRSAANEIAVSIDEVVQNISQLTDFMDKSISTMTEISSTIRSVQENGVRSHEMSQTVKEQAEKGAEAVANAQYGLHGISEAVEGTVESIRRLCQKGEEVGSINEVITEISQKTNLLALNASIIAAQAGEHGHSFAVVAEEVRKLSQETAQSTGVISYIIEEIQKYSQETGRQAETTRQLVQDGIAQGEHVEEALNQILDSASLAMDMSREIRKATEEVSKSADFVTGSIERLGEMAAHISQASKEQSQGTRSIAQSIEEIKTMADEMAEATDRQKTHTKDIETAVGSVSNIAGRIFSAIEERQKGSREVIESLERLRRIGSKGT